MKILNKIMLFLILFISACSICGCSMKNITSSDEEEEFIVILHAGGGYDELTYLNAQETFEYYYKMGYRFFEYDLKLSSDGKIIATHNWEHIDISDPSNITYEEFKKIRLDNGFTPVNEEWLIETIIKYPDVRFIIDAKMDSIEGDSAVITRLETLKAVYKVYISQNIIPEIFSKEMWDIVEEKTSFDLYLFSHYKVYYTVDEMLKYFNDERIWGVALSTYTNTDVFTQLSKMKTKIILVFTPINKEEVEDAKVNGADGVYLDFVSLLE